MADFKKCMDFVLKHEGGFSDNEADPGGTTNFGISWHYLSLKDPEGFKNGTYTEDFMKHMSLQFAMDIYFEDWWKKYNYEAIKDDGVAAKVFDLAVNSGPLKSHRTLQRALNEINGNENLKVDGVLGPKTFNVLNLTNPNLIVSKMIELEIDFYETIAKIHPTQKIFLKGWLRRAKDYLGNDTEY